MYNNIKYSIWFNIIRERILAKNTWLYTICVILAIICYLSIIKEKNADLKHKIQFYMVCVRCALQNCIVYNFTSLHIIYEYTYYAILNSNIIVINYSIKSSYCFRGMFYTIPLESKIYKCIKELIFYIICVGYIYYIL